MGAECGVRRMSYTLYVYFMGKTYTAINSFSISLPAESLGT